MIGLEINVSLDIEVKHNDIHDNTVGIGLFHPNTAGNRPLPEMGNWVVEHNNVYDNNTPNFAPPGELPGRPAARRRDPGAGRVRQRGREEHGRGQ